MVAGKSLSSKITGLLAAGVILAACVPASTPSPRPTLTGLPTSTPATATPSPTAIPAPSPTHLPPTPTRTLTPTPAGACLLIPASISARFALPNGVTTPVSSAVEKIVPVDATTSIVQAVILLGEPPAGAKPEVSFQMAGGCADQFTVQLETLSGTAAGSAVRGIEAGRFTLSLAPGAAGLPANVLIQIPHGEASQMDEISVVMARLPDAISSLSLALPASGGMTAELHAKIPWLAGDYTITAISGQFSASTKCRVYTPDPKILFCTFPQIPPYDTPFTLTPFLDILGKPDLQVNSGITGLVKAPASVKTPAPTQPSGGGGGGSPPGTPEPCPPWGCSGNE